MLHCCCAPCASYVLECLIPRYDITLFFYNPNIEPQAEFEKRKNELSKLLKMALFESDIDLIECEYNNTVFSNSVLSLRGEPEGGQRCRVCFELRLRETAIKTRAGEYDIFATTLTVSPHKDAELINEIGNNISNELNVEYLPSDFKTNDGFKRSVELSKRYGLYRQGYCGCKCV